MMKIAAIAAASRQAGMARFTISAFLAASILIGSAPVRAEDAGTVIQLSDADRQELDSLLGPGVVGEALPAKPLLAPEAYMLRDGNRLSYRAHDTDGNTWTENHDFAVAPATETGGGRGWDYKISQQRRAIFVLQADGSLATIREYDGKQKVISSFSPGEPLIIPGLEPGQSRDTDIQVTVADINDPTDVDYRGHLNVTYAHLGRYRVKVPSGSYDADLIKWTYHGKVGPAHIKTSQYRFLAEKDAMIAMIELRNISAMLIYHDDTREGKLLLGPTQQ